MAPFDTRKAPVGLSVARNNVDRIGPLDSGSIQGSPLQHGYLISTLESGNVCMEGTDQILGCIAVRIRRVIAVRISGLRPAGGEALFGPRTSKGQ